MYAVLPPLLCVIQSCFRRPSFVSRTPLSVVSGIQTTEGGGIDGGVPGWAELRSGRGSGTGDDRGKRELGRSQHGSITSDPGESEPVRQQHQTKWPPSI